MVFRTLLYGLVLAALIGGPDGASARSQPVAKERREGKPTSNQWVAMVVTRITRAGEGPTAASPGGSVTVRVRIGSDGSLEGAAVDESSGSTSLDERALQAVKAASPFAPPPEKLLTLEGFTELTFPLEFERAGK